MGLRNTFDRLIAAREKQARRYVNGALLSMNDDVLAQAGYNRDELKMQGSAVYPF